MQNTLQITSSIADPGSFPGGPAPGNAPVAADTGFIAMLAALQVSSVAVQANIDTPTGTGKELPLAGEELPLPPVLPGLSFSSPVATGSANTGLTGALPAVEGAALAATTVPMQRAALLPAVRGEASASGQYEIVNPADDGLTSALPAAAPLAAQRGGQAGLSLEPVQQATESILTTLQGRQGVASLAGPEQSLTVNPLSPAPLSTGDAAVPVLRTAMTETAGSPHWHANLSERVHWIASQGVQKAEIQLHPASLGAIEVHIRIEHDQASLVFVSAQAGVREALEAALPRLRETLGMDGLVLTDAQVQSDAGASRQSSSQQEFSRTHNNASPDTDDVTSGDMALSRFTGSADRGLVDYYI